MKISDKEFKLFAQKMALNLKKYRNDIPLTQEQCAEKIGIEYKYYQRIEQADANITMKTLYKICKTLDINPRDLFE